MTCRHTQYHLTNALSDKDICGRRCVTGHAFTEVNLNKDYCTLTRGHTGACGAPDYCDLCELHARLAEIEHQNTDLQTRNTELVKQLSYILKSLQGLILTLDINS